MKVFVVEGANHYADIFKNVEITYNIEEADIVMFTGGADVNPELYGENTGVHTGVNEMRDYREIEWFKKAQSLNKPCLGICRGNQLLTVLSGGKLIQHINNHAIFGTHKIITLEGELNITSTHHQMVYPYELPDEDFTVIGWTPQRLATIYLDGDNKEHPFARIPAQEPEIVKYHKTNCLCIQGHPEMQLDDKEFIKKINTIINKYLLNNE